MSNFILPSEINRCIASMLRIDAGNPEDSSCDSLTQKHGYFTQFDVIRNAFEANKTKPIQKVDIATRLSLIDLFYSTNLNRYAEYGIADLTYSIWNLSTDTTGNHSDAVLAKKAEAFVDECANNQSVARENPIFTHLFSQYAKFGIGAIGDPKGDIGINADSIISKYLFFLLESYHSKGNTLGYPIYDSIAKSLQSHLIKKLGIEKTPGNDMVAYVKKMYDILICLESSNDPSSWIWKLLSAVCNTKFGLLDFFLWRIGKSGQFSFSLLWTKEEKKQHYPVAKRLAKGNSSNYTNDFNSLPKRFQDWYNIYNSINR